MKIFLTAIILLGLAYVLLNTYLDLVVKKKRVDPANLVFLKPGVDYFPKEKVQ